MEARMTKASAFVAFARARAANAEARARARESRGRTRMPSANANGVTSKTAAYGGGDDGGVASKDDGAGAPRGQALVDARANAIGLKVVSASPVARDYAALTGVRIVVDFEIHYEAVFGQDVRVLGSHDALGAWDQKRAVALKWHQGNVWKASVELPAGGIFFYKYVVKASDGSTVRWQDGSNSMLVLPESWNMPKGSHYLVEDNFSGIPNESTEASENLLANKLANVQGEKKVLLDQLQMQKHMTQTALEELLLAREDLAQAQSKLLGSGQPSKANDYNGSTR